MPTVRITVLRDGEPVSGHRVALGVDGLEHGVTSSEVTDSDGVAEFDVDYGQGGDVFVDGANVARWGSYSGTDVTVDL
jgi:hypothetical protein